MLIVSHGDKMIIKDFEVPEMVTVRITGEKICKENLPFTIEQIEFKEYVKGVLPNEWHVGWEMESLKAGSVAIKNYAWSKLQVGAVIWDCNWSQVYDPSGRTDKTDRAVEEAWDWWIVNENGEPLRTFYNANAEGCSTQPPDCMSQINSQKFAEYGNWSFDKILQFYYSGMLVKTNTPNLAKENGFPYISQTTDGAQYSNDCASAAILMVAKYYGVAGDETVDENHKDMMDGDYPVNYLNAREYLENRYELKTEIVTTYKATKDALEDMDFDVSMIEVVEGIPFDIPVIWIYMVTPHWVVRYEGWNYDSYNGIFPFGETATLRNLYKPELGLGIIVYGPSVVKKESLNGLFP